MNTTEIQPKEEFAKQLRQFSVADLALLAQIYSAVVPGVSDPVLQSALNAVTATLEYVVELKQEKEHGKAND